MEHMLITRKHKKKKTLHKKSHLFVFFFVFHSLCILGVRYSRPQAPTNQHISDNKYSCQWILHIPIYNFKRCPYSLAVFFHIHLLPCCMLLPEPTSSDKSSFLSPDKLNLRLTADGTCLWPKLSCFCLFYSWCLLS